ncbi:MAG: endonuclease domain-containing protein [Clostridiales Family XIII bacterium]|jgi:hypothetical protein|nr:endonuclease domain-containing protein [Clostridiales Family XIII bacterium]
MKKFVSHNSAAEYWQIPYMTSVLHPTSGDKLAPTENEHYGVTCRKDRRPSADYHCHLNSVALPPDAIVNTQDRQVASPPLVFLEYASILPFHSLVLLGLQMCSHPPGKPELALTTKQQLSAFVEEMNRRKVRRLRGQPRALKALKYIENGSDSIMESLTFMLLTLPQVHGGYGLKGACFNHEIPLTPTAQRRLGQRRCFVDLYYPAARLAVEYDSFKHHSTPAEQGKDMLRASALERQGISVMPLSPLQLYDKLSFEEFAYNLAARLGKRIRNEAKNFDTAHGKIRALLPTAIVPH